MVACSLIGLLALPACRCGAADEAGPSPAGASADPASNPNEAAGGAETANAADENPEAAARVFTERVADLARELHPEQTITVVEPLLLRFGDIELGLWNVERICQTDPDVCDTEIERWLALAADRLRGVVAPADISQVRAMLVNRAALGTMLAENPEAVLHADFAGDMSVVYVVDQPSTIELLTPT